ncbi:MAG: hypothetical protein QM722_24645 [Piscinibacter sp.]
MRFAHGFAAGAVALAVAGAWLMAADDEPVAAEAPLAAGVSSLPMQAVDRQSPAVVEPPPSALAVAAAQLCAGGCDAQPAPGSEPSPVRIGEAVLQPVDLDAWSLSPEPLLVATAPVADARLFNTPPAPDEHDTTPADETDPYAPPSEQPTAE